MCRPYFPFFIFLSLLRSQFQIGEYALTMITELRHVRPCSPRTENLVMPRVFSKRKPNPMAEFRVRVVLEWENPAHGGVAMKVAYLTK